MPFDEAAGYDSYVPRRRRRLPKRALVGLVPLAIAIDVLRGGDWLGGFLWLAGAAVFGLAPISRAWGGAPPFRLGPAGIDMVDVEDGIGHRLLPWSEIASVVLLRSGRQLLFGLRLTGQPDDGVHLTRTLAGWTVDPVALGAEVTRFGARFELDLPTGPSTPLVGPAELARTAGRPTSAPVPDGRPLVEFHRPARYRAVDPEAYVARFTLRANAVWLIAGLGIEAVAVAVVRSGSVVGGGLLMLMGLTFLYAFWLAVRGGGPTAFAVDRDGIFLGESGAPGEDPEHRLVPWSRIGEVVIYEQLVRSNDDGHWRPAVGVRPPGLPEPVRDRRVVQGWQLDRAALEAAVARFAPGTRVVDGPRQRPRDPREWF